MGNMNNTTILPMPITIHSIMTVSEEVLAGDLTKFTLNRKESLENVVIKWTRSIHDVIKEQSYDILKTNKMATPADEIQFWSARLKNLINIDDQLNSEEIKTVGKLLEHTGSTYFHPLKKSIESVTAALDEARDISLYLQPLVQIVNLFFFNTIIYFAYYFRTNK